MTPDQRRKKTYLTYSSGDFQKRFREIMDLAMREPVLITTYGKPTVIVFDIDLFEDVCGPLQRPFHFAPKRPKPDSTGE